MRIAMLLLEFAKSILTDVDPANSPVFRMIILLLGFTVGVVGMRRGVRTFWLDTTPPTFDVWIWPGLFLGGLSGWAGYCCARAQIETLVRYLGHAGTQWAIALFFAGIVPIFIILMLSLALEGPRGLRRVICPVKVRH